MTIGAVAIASGPIGGPEGAAVTATGSPIIGFAIETTPGTWVDYGTRLVAGSVTRGRQEELDRYGAGTCELTLNNADRLFDPSYASSPLNGHILPMKQIRVTGTWAGVTHPLFTGYADRWTQNYEVPRYATTTVTATDGTKILARALLPASVYAYEVAADEPVAWWRLDEGGGTVAYDEVGNLDLDVTVGAGPTMGETTLVARDPGSSISITDVSYGLRRDNVVPPVTGPPMTIEAVIRSDVFTNGFIAGYQGYIGYGFDLRTTAGGMFTAGTTNDVTGTVINDGASISGDGQVHHLAGVWAADGTMQLYIDGFASSDPSTGAVGGTFASPGWIAIGAYEPLVGMSGGIDEVAFYDYALTPARIAAHAAAITTPWDNELPGERVDRILDAVGWPAGARDVDTGVTTLQPAELDMAALDHLQKVARSEFGNVYVTADGTLRFEDRASSVNQPAAADFSDAAGTGLPITYSAPELSDRHIRNDVTVSRLDGVAQNVKDAASIATYQISSYVVDGLYHDDDQHSRYAAQFLLAAYKDPHERVSRLTVNPSRDPDELWPAILSVDLTDRISLEETPVLVAPAVTRTLVVEGISHSFGTAAGSWETVYDVSESPVAVTAYWALGVAGASELGETTRLWF